MLVVTRYRVEAPEASEFAALSQRALQSLTAQAGCTAGWVARNVDEPDLWTITTTWSSVGAYRRALSSYDVKLHAVPVMYRAIDEPSAYEDLFTWTPDDGLRTHQPDRAADA